MKEDEHNIINYDKLADDTQNLNLEVRRHIIKEGRYDEVKYNKVVDDTRKLLNHYLKNNDTNKIDVLKESFNHLEKLKKKHCKTTSSNLIKLHL